MLAHAILDLGAQRLAYDAALPSPMLKPTAESEPKCLSTTDSSLHAEHGSHGWEEKEGGASGDKKWLGSDTPGMVHLVPFQPTWPILLTVAFLGVAGAKLRVTIGRGERVYMQHYVHPDGQGMVQVTVDGEKPTIVDGCVGAIMAKGGIYTKTVIAEGLDPNLASHTIEVEILGRTTSPCRDVTNTFSIIGFFAVMVDQ